MTTERRPPFMRIAVCEDNKHHMGIVSYLLGRYIETHPGVEIHWDGYATGRALLDSLRQRREYDLYLLDILLPDLSGIAIAKTIREERADAVLIFLTASADYALDAFHVSAMQYLLKPVRETTLFPALDKVVAALDPRRKRTPFFLISTASEIRAVPHSALVYVESWQRTLLVYLDDGKIQSKPFRSSFELAVAPLLDDGHFLHAHKSYVLNMDHVLRVTDRSFCMSNGEEIFIPRYKFAEMKGRYLDYVASSGGGILGESASERITVFTDAMARESSYS